MRPIFVACAAPRRALQRARPALRLHSGTFPQPDPRPPHLDHQRCRSIADRRAFSLAPINPWWLNEYNLLPGGDWMVLNRINWSNQAAAKTTVTTGRYRAESAEGIRCLRVLVEPLSGPLQATARLCFDELPATGHLQHCRSVRQLTVLTSSAPTVTSTSGAVDLVSVEWSHGSYAWKEPGRSRGSLRSLRPCA